MNLDKLLYKLENPIYPSGKFESDIYLLLDSVQDGNIKKNSPLSDETKTILIRALKESGLIKEESEIDNKFRISNPLIYKLISKNGNKEFGRQFTEDDLNSLKVLNQTDIKKSKPKLIIACGLLAIKTLDIKDSLYVAKDNTYTFIDIPVFVSPNISSILRSENSDAIYKDLIKCFNKAKNFLDGNDYTLIEKNLSYEIIDIFNIEEIKKLNNIFEGYKELILDYETSGLDAYRWNFYLGGFGLTSLDRKKSVYIYFYDLWRLRKDNPNPPEENIKALREFMLTKDYKAFNKMYECSVSSSPVVGLNLELGHIEDILMNLRTLGKSNNLKDACVERLGIKKWNDSIDVWRQLIDQFVSLEKPTKVMKNHREEIEWIKEDKNRTINDLNEFYKIKFYNELFKEFKRFVKGNSKLLNPNDSDCIKLYQFLNENKIKLNSNKYKEELLTTIINFDFYPNKLLFEFKNTREKFLKQKDLRLIELINSIKTLCESHFSKEKLNELFFKLTNYLLYQLDNHEKYEGAPFADIPLELIGKYCVLDCNYTAALHHSVKEELNQKNLEEASKVYNNHAYLGYKMSQNGIAWNDELANELSKEYSEVNLEALRSMLLLPKMAILLELSQFDLLKIQCSSNIDELKKFFNPNNTSPSTPADRSTKYILSKLMSSNRFKIACILYESYEYSKTLSNPDECYNFYPNIYPLYKEISEIDDYQKRMTFLDNILKNGKILDEKIIESRKEMYKEGKEYYNNEVELKIKYKDWILENTGQEEGIKRCYLIFKTIFGINPNDKETWPEEFLPLYYFKIFKKSEKCVNSYIDGDCGRSLVRIVDDNHEFGHIYTHKAYYRERKKRPGECYILKPNWGVCTALTKRWQSNQHNIPSGTDLLNLRTSRFKDGIKLHFDKSQAEVRVLAKMSNCVGLLKAFEEGLDSHKYNASRTYGVSMEEVTEEQRRVAKAITFSILYGKSLPEFANEFVKGNIKEAALIFENFFKSFPEVETFIKEMHIQGSTNDWVPGIFGDPIFVQTPKWFFNLDSKDQYKLIKNPYDKSVKLGLNDYDSERLERSKFAKCLRNSQNYCIQNSSSMLTGSCLYNIQNFIESNKLTSKIECFTHDAGDIDVQIKNLMMMMYNIPILTVGYLKKRFDIPMQIDFAVGISNNKMVKLEHVVQENGIITCEYSAKEESVNLLSDKLTKHGLIVTNTIEKEKEKILSMENLFLTKTAYSGNIGKPYKEISGKLELKAA